MMEEYERFAKLAGACYRFESYVVNLSLTSHVCIEAQKNRLMVHDSSPDMWQTLETLTKLVY